MYTAQFLIWTKNRQSKRFKRQSNKNQMATTPSKRGGKRAGAGRKPNPIKTLFIPVPVEAIGQQPTAQLSDSLAHKDPKVFLLALMNDLEADVKLRADAAKALMPFMHPKIAEGVKDQRKEAAKKAGAGKFGASAPPRLIVNNRG